MAPVSGLRNKTQLGMGCVQVMARDWSVSCEELGRKWGGGLLQETVSCFLMVRFLFLLLDREE